ncbi:MAG: ATP-binding protein [Acidobacteria bacterium]|nr:ATP-binding protein [Acidobacteriota bacterium]
MVRRGFWLRRIEQAWARRPVIWLFGARRAGKTVLAQSIAGADYYDCELHSVRTRLADPEIFWKQHSGRTVALDEVHRLPNPSEVLKIAADHYPKTRVLATGSSTLGASSRFRDTLAGRKAEVWLTPMNSPDLKDFGGSDLPGRFLRGGLPPFFLASGTPSGAFQEWMDAFWARDIQELFRVERRTSFQRFTELLLTQSGGIFEAASFAAPCEISRTTVSNYLSVLEATRVAHVIRPFSSRKAAEIVAVPKVYGFDTGFVCHYRGWDPLRQEDLGPLWEHYVLNEIHSRLPGRPVSYWRDKQKHEIDFVLPGRGRRPPVAVECKWSAADFSPDNLRAFRNRYPEGRNLVVAPHVASSYERRYGSQMVQFVNLEDFIREMEQVH